MKKLSILLASLALFACKNDKTVGSQNENEEIQVVTEISKAETNAHPTEVFWGDTHLHTNLSMDAGLFGNRIGLDEAYKFAKGEEVTASIGMKAKLSRPLDFLVVADHSDGMGLFQAIDAGEEWVMKTKQGKRWNELLKSGEGAVAALELIKAFSNTKLDMNPNDPGLQKSVWTATVEAAEKYNDPGKFTAFIGYEWTSLDKGNNLHRVVIYRDDADKTLGQIPAVTNALSPDPETLWPQLESYEKNTGGKVLAIAHNGNLSNGVMFAETRMNGEAFDESYVKERIKWEPLYEATQIKGDGEAHPYLSPNDEFADFENWDFGNLDLSVKKTNDMLAGEYARSALKLGLKFKNKLGTNPFKFGLIGSTDSHTTLATADDNNFFGKATNVEPSPERWKHPFVTSDQGVIMTWQTVASGYAAVWANENTRASLWDAMKRKETYATTGPRMQLRFFGGFNYNDDDLNNLVDAGYNKGVPMGGDIKNAGSKTPTFMTYALMDPEGGSLDRVQIVKGWANADGSLSEKVYDVIWSGDREINANEKVPAIANTVNLEDATWDNSTGSTELKAVWVDPDFDPSLEAFYYLRVIEIPTPRWTLYDKLRFDIKDMSEEVPMTAQQRGYTSPIWYSPK